MCRRYYKLLKIRSPAAVVDIGKACGTLLKFGQLIDTDQRPLGCEIYL